MKLLSLDQIEANVEDEIRHAAEMEAASSIFDGLAGTKRAWTARRAGFETVLRWLTGECACTPEVECEACGAAVEAHESRGD